MPQSAVRSTVNSLDWRPRKSYHKGALKDEICQENYVLSNGYSLNSISHELGGVSVVTFAKVSLILKTRGLCLRGEASVPFR